MSADDVGGGRCIVETIAGKFAGQALTGKRRRDIGRRKGAGKPIGRLNVGDG
jgi:hypothetical protein